MSEQKNTAAPMSAQEWRDKEFLPWKAAAEKYREEREAQTAALRGNGAQLQVIVALIADGKTRQAVLAWNALGMHPRLRDIRLSGDGQAMTLVPEGGDARVVRIDDLIADLQRLLDMPRG